MTHRPALVMHCLVAAVLVACGNHAGPTGDGGRGARASKKSAGSGPTDNADRGPPRPFVVRVGTDSGPTDATRTLRVETSTTGLAGPYRAVGTWDGQRPLEPMLPARLPNTPVAIDTRGAVLAAELERVLAALDQRGVREATVHAPDMRPLPVRVNMDEIDVLFGFNVLLRAADARWTTWTAGGMHSLWILDVGPESANEEATPLGEQIRLRRPQRVIIAHGGGRGGVPGWMRRVRTACETCRSVGCECFVGSEPIVDNGAPAAGPTARMNATITVTRGGPSVADVARLLGGEVGADPSAPIELRALQACAYRPNEVESARLSATLTVGRDGYARDIAGEPLPFPMRCVADVLSRRVYPSAPQEYRITLSAELTERGNPVPRLRDRIARRERERAMPTPSPER